MFPLNYLPELPTGPWLFAVLAAIVIGSSVPIITIVVVAEPILMAVMLATNHTLSVPALIAVTIMAAVIGDIASYGLGRAFGPKLLTTKIVCRSRKQINGAHHKIRRRGVLGAMVIQRWVPPTRGFVPAFLGAGRQAFGQFVGYSAIASAGWAFVLVLGTHFGGPTLVLAIPVVVTVPVAIRAGRSLILRLRARGDGTRTVDTGSF